jgi:hypothetical protein
MYLLAAVGNASAGSASVELWRYANAGWGGLDWAAGDAAGRRAGLWRARRRGGRLDPERPRLAAAGRVLMLLHVCTQPKRADGTGGGRGKRVGGVLRYLFGPGREEEHTNSRFGEGPQMGTPYGRLVAASGAKPLAELQPQHTDREHFDFRPLVDWLEELPRAAGVLRRVDGRHDGSGWVWHASLRLAPEDRHRDLSDQTWARIVREMLRGAGLVVDGDEAGARWVVVRHADDHVHIVAGLVREDGSREWFGNDFARCIAATREVAARLGLRQVGRTGGTGHRRSHPVEVHKAARQGRFTSDGGVLTVRDELRRRVRAAAVAAGSPEEFVTRLHGQGVRVEFRYSEANPGEKTGVRFALVSDATAAGMPVWYGGGKLAPDLTWPRLIARWATGRSFPPCGVGPARVVAEAEQIVRAATARMRRGGERDAAVIGQGAADCMTAGAWLLDGGPDGPLVQAAERLDQATRQPRGDRLPPGPDVFGLRVLAQALFALRAGTDDERERQTLKMMYALCVLVERIARLRDRQQRAGQPAHARAAAATVRNRRRVSLRDRSRGLTSAERVRYAAVVGEVLPDRAVRILAEPTWEALAAALRVVEAGGGDPREALRTVARWRGLGTAVSISEVLVWRLHRLGVVDLAASATGRTAPAWRGSRSSRRAPAAEPGRRPTR